jgi:hemerythrin-like domain-containing protein
MSKVIDRLREDHRNMARILDILARETCTFRDGGIADFDLIENILDYNLEYPDLFHHPAEDVIFQKLKGRDPATWKNLGDLAREHQQLHALTYRFAAAVRNVLLDQELPRGWLVDVATDYLTFARRHMQMEEVILFPLAKRTLTPAEWAEIRDEIASRPDPLQEVAVENRYRKLRQGILEWAGAA